MSTTETTRGDARSQCKACDQAAERGTALCTECIDWYEALHSFSNGTSAYEPDTGECSGCGDLFCTCAE